MAGEDQRAAELEAALAETRERAFALVARGQSLAAELDQVRAQLADQSWRNAGRRQGQVEEFAGTLEAAVGARLATIRAQADQALQDAQERAARDREQADHSHTTLLSLAREDIEQLRAATARQAEVTVEEGKRRAREARTSADVDDTCGRLYLRPAITGAGINQMFRKKLIPVGNSRQIDDFIAFQN
jgi:membrane-associated HD superfamily phosphohydrolase